MNALSTALPVRELDLALAEFCGTLTDEQRRDLSKIRSVPDADSILVFTAQLDATNRSRKGQSVGSRMSKALQSTRDFCAVINTFVSSNPQIAALVWGSVQLTMQIILNYTSYYEAISSLFMHIGHLCPLFVEYGTLYSTSTRLQASLSDFHASIVRCCKHVIEAIQRPWQYQVLQAFYRSFDQEFQSDKDDIRRYSDRVKDAIYSAKAHIDEQERQLQVQDRKAALETRNSFKAYITRNQREKDEESEQRLKRNIRKIQDRKQQLLETLCAHRPERLLKHNQRKRFRDTASWILGTAGFQSWMDTKGPPLLWCSGKSHSASVVDHLLLEKARSRFSIAYFFVDSSDRQSLDIETIMASILRQTLPEATQLSNETEDNLRSLIDNMNLEKTVKVLQDVAPKSWPFYVVIDGIDECEKADQGKLLKTLSSLFAATSNAKLFLSSRESLEREIRIHFSVVEKISMDHSDAQGDIATYIHGTLQEKREQQELIVGDTGLITEIEQALNQRADGMFLWVFFQVQELCEQTCDKDIRDTIENLPEDLEETFRRVLRRILSRRYSKLAQKVFPWIAGSARPLTLEEFREAIAIEIGQQYSKPELLCHDVNTIILACENLVHVDEEDQSVRFAHESIRQFLVQQPVATHSPNDDIAKFYIDLEEADHFIGEICLTYINFTDFKTTLARPSKPIALPSPTDIALKTLGPRSKMASILRRALQPREVPVSIVSKADSESKTFSNSHPFLNYALAYWMLHTKNFQHNRSKMWSLWQQIIFAGHDLAKTPWQSTSWESDQYVALRWAIQANHTSLVSFIISSHGFSWLEGKEAFYEAIRDNNSSVIDVILLCRVLPEVASHILPKAVTIGDLDVVEKLLAAGADVDLLRAGADVNATNHNGGTTLYLAAFNGHLDIVKQLLAAGADVNSTTMNGSTALHIAAFKGHLGILQQLLDAGADDGAPQLGTKNVYSDIVKTLLAAGANANLTSVNLRATGSTPEHEPS
ncbi:hypothetical protein GGR51DRAFT_547299 [Nemania sp. FL0031]|nr:hypothetical protein GGR51DRAFT_547299 [Nemania sp. FL0031]